MTYFVVLQHPAQSRLSGELMPSVLIEHIYTKEQEAIDEVKKLAEAHAKGIGGRCQVGDLGAKIWGVTNHLMAWYEIKEHYQDEV